jgi:2,5-diamino-6-(ribosylamino)-4(3H)-pyrimidinone 5'-phosphate reductase
MTLGNRPFTTLFMLMSVDGKISTGDNDDMDVDADFPNIAGVREGLQQYYDIEAQTDFFSFISGKVLAKIGINEKEDIPEPTSVTCVIVDNAPHVQEKGIVYLAKKRKDVIVATTHPQHPANLVAQTMHNVHVVRYEKNIDFADLFSKLKSDFGAERLTIQSGGTLNTLLVREGLIDRVLLVVAPALIGGKETATLLDGESLHVKEDLKHIRALELVQATPLKDSYLLLEYVVK